MHAARGARCQRRVRGTGYHPSVQEERKSRHSLAAEPMPEVAAHALSSVRALLFDVDERTLSPARRGALFVARLTWITVRAFFRDRVQMRAAALSYTTVLAIVPALALAFALARATGLYALMVDETVEPLLDEWLAGSDTGVRTLRGLADSLLLMVESTRVEGLGVMGALALVLAVVRVNLGIEEALSDIAGHHGPPRPIWVRLRAFVIVMAITPMGLTYAVAVSAFTHDTAAAALLRATVPFELLRDALLWVLPIALCFAAIFTAYIELPSAEIRRRSAAIGAFFAALAWYGVQLLHVRFQVSVARWNAVYSGFGAFPILMLSIHLSWVVLLLGAQIAAAHQNAPSLRQMARGSLADHRSRAELALRAAVALARAGGPLRLRALARELSIGVRELRSVLDALVEHDLVRVRTARDDRHYTLAVEPEALRTSAVLSAIERSAWDVDVPWQDEPAVREVMHGLVRAADASSHNVTIAELAVRARPSDAGTPVAAADDTVREEPTGTPPEAR